MAWMRRAGDTEGGDDVKQARRRARLRRVKRAAARGTLLLGVAVLVRWPFAAREPVYPVTAPDGLPHSGLDRAPMQGANAAHFYAAAVDVLPERLYQFDPDRATPEETRAAVADARESLALLRTGFGYRYQGFRTRWTKGAPPQGLDAPMPNFMALRTLARLLVADARIKGAAGDHAGALGSSLDAVRLGQDLSREGESLIEGMVGVLVQNIGGKEALDHVAGLSGPQTRAALRRARALDATAVPFTRLMEGERRFGYAALRQLFGPGGSGVLGMERSLSDMTARAACTGLVLWYGKQGTVDEYARIADETVRRAALPYQEAKALGDVPQSSNWVVAMAVPNSTRAHGNWARAEAWRGLLLARLAVRAHAAEHNGAAPCSLRGLAAGATPYLTSVPADPFSPTGDAPLRYADGRVWTVGEDGNDDRGAGDDGSTGPATAATRRPRACPIGRATGTPRR